MVAVGATMPSATVGAAMASGFGAGSVVMPRSRFAVVHSTGATTHSDFGSGINSGCNSAVDSDFKVMASATMAVRLRLCSIRCLFRHLRIRS